MRKKENSGTTGKNRENEKFEPKRSRNPKFYYPVNNSPPLLPIMSQINPLHIT